MLSSPQSPEKASDAQSEKQKLERIRHTCAHILAMAVQKLFPETKVTIGPWTDNGFYYDFDRSTPFTPDDLKRLTKEMRRIIKANLPIIREVVERDEIQAEIAALQEPYKQEILDGIPEGEQITRYFIGSPDAGFASHPELEPSLIDPVTVPPTEVWWDLCAGPHLNFTGEIHPKAFALESVAGAYWRGDETKAQLQRIYGTAWETPEQLAEHKRRKEEALKRDHRKLGKELGLFIFADPVGPGLPLWTPKGTILRSQLEDYLKQEQVKRGYLPVVTPHIAKVDLFKVSGHWQNYKEDMFPLMAESAEAAEAEQGFVMKPMNCPFHIQIYKSQLRSYRELPIRLAEFGTVYRYEQSGELGGLTRVRGFTVDDSHLFVTPEQLDDEFLKVVDLILSVFKSLQLKNFKARLSFRDPNSDKYIGSDELWETAQGAIRRAVQALDMDYFEAEGEAAFYGPKLDFIFEDALEREWQLGTVQVDYNLPNRFELEYIAEDGSRQRPIMIHRAPFGSLERLIGILIEEYAGDFPLWLAPTQIRLLPVSDVHREFVEDVAAKMQAMGIRAEADNSRERLGKMIRNSEKQKIPVMAVVGDKEVEGNSLSIRTRASGELGAIPVAEVMDRLKNAITNYSNF